MAKILIVDDDTTFCIMLKNWLEKRGFEVENAFSYKEAVKKLEKASFDLVLTDLRLPDKDGIDLLRVIKEKTPDTQVLLMTGYADIQTAVTAIKLGAFDYVAKPVIPDEILKKLQEALKLEAEPVGKPVPAKAKTTSFAYIKGVSEGADRQYEYIHLVGPTMMTVLINGESGTGKEYIARLIHSMSNRKDAPFVAVDCGAIPRDLAASEFFGHVKGSFTGAVGDKQGYFVTASGGTIFLDEIGDLELSCQVKLLRVLQDQTFEVLGDSRPRKVDIRVVSATNRDLRSMVADRTFREDLFYRINLITVHLPALRERREDIPLLARYFADKQSEVNGLPRVEFSSDAQTYLSRLPFLGNIRELKNLVERTILVSGKTLLDAADFEVHCVDTSSSKSTIPSSLEGLTLDELEKQTILRSLEAHGGNLSHVATALGISRAALYRRLEKYGIPIDK